MNIYLDKRDFESLDLGYVFNKDYWRQGYAKESSEALIQKAFADGIHRIYAECDPENTASWRCLEGYLCIFSFEIIKIYKHNNILE